MNNDEYRMSVAIENGEVAQLKQDCRNYLHEVEQLRAQIVALGEQASAPDGWIPVSERLPNIAQEVIVHAQFDGVCAGVRDSYGEWFASSSDYKLSRVNSWMPLPAAPQPSDDIRCKCCGYLVTESEHRGCLRSAEPVSDDELVGSLEDCVGWLDWLYHPDHDDKFKSQLARIRRAKEALATHRAAQEQTK